MEITILTYIVIAVLASIAIAYFQYFYKTKNKSNINLVLFSLKALSLFLLLLLFINPKIKVTKTQNSKPNLSVLIDNSSSIKYFKQEKNVQKIVQELQQHKKINTKFNVQYFAFGKETIVSDSLTFKETQTDISKAITAIDALHANKKNATILISDGNQTTGNDYQYTNPKNKIYPIVVGDTTRYQDIQISQLNVNKYSYIKNKFPVETLLYYEGNKTVNATYTISHNGRKVFTKKLSFSPTNPTHTITTNLTSNKKGVQYYTASISKITNEKNTKNNHKNFSVEVIDEQTNILLLSSILHPDLGAIKKAIESNKQRKVTTALIKDKNIKFDDYQFFILYQPNYYFTKVFQKINTNYLVVSGTKTDWNFLNKQKIGIKKQAISQSEDYSAIYNPNFSTFLQKDIGFNEFPPLQDKFGEVQINADSQTLLHQKYANINTIQPLLTTIDNNTKKYAVLFGEGIWKWRAASFLKEQSFDVFDAFLGNLVQYLASTKKRKRLDIKSKQLYPANEPITIAAFYVDKNYKFDNRAALELYLTNNKTKQKKSLPFSLVNNAYQVSVEGLLPGDYSYQVKVIDQKINAYGKFKITDYQIEEQFTNANAKKLNTLALKTKTTLHHSNTITTLLDKLATDNSYYTVQKSITKKQNLIDWKWILLAAILLLSIEWFLRKYYGKI